MTLRMEAMCEGGQSIKFKGDSDPVDFMNLSYLPWTLNSGPLWSLYEKEIHLPIV